MATSIIAAAVSLIGGAFAVSQQKKAATKQKRAQREARLKTEAETRKLEEAPEIAKEKARRAAISRRKAKTKTLLTGASGVEDEGTLLKPKLGS
jgi:hypothetical protein